MVQIAGNDQAASLQACALRVTRLDVNGATPAGASGMIVTKGLISLAVSPQYEDGDELSVKNGCGEIVIFRKDPSSFKNATLTLTYSDPNIEVAEMMTDGTLLTQSGQSIGYSAPAIGDAGTSAVCLEVWSKAWIGGSAPRGRTFSDATTTSASPNLTSGGANFNLQDVGRTITGTGIPGGTTILTVTNATTIVLSANATASATNVAITIGRPGPYYRWVFPRVEATLGDFTLENAAMNMVFSGPASENLGIGNGPFNDFPTGLDFSRVYSYFRDTALPDLTTVGYQNIPAQV